MVMQSKPEKVGTESIDIKSIDRDFRYGRAMKMFTSRNDDCKYRIARSRNELGNVFRLIHGEYLRQGLTQSNRLNLRILPHQLLQTSWIFTALQNENTVATLSLVEDSQIGIPLDGMYGEKISQLRQGGTRLAELTCLAHRPHTLETMWNRGKVTSALGMLMGLVNSLALKRGVEALVICVHPRHANFYQRRYGFAELGAERCCSWAKNHPAKALLLDQRGMTAALNVFQASARSCQIAEHLNSTHQAERPNPVSPGAIAHFWRLLDQVSPISIPPQDSLGMTA